MKRDELFEEERHKICSHICGQGDQRTGRYLANVIRNTWVYEEVKGDRVTSSEKVLGRVLAWIDDDELLKAIEDYECGVTGDERRV